MGSDKGIGLGKQRIVGTGRLLLHHITAIAREQLALQGFGHSLFIHQRTASEINQDGTM